MAITTYYMALCSSLADLDNFGDEIGGNSYVRAPVDMDLTEPPGTPVGESVTAAVFPNLSHYDWPAVGWGELWTAVTGGTRLMPIALVGADGLPVTLRIGEGGTGRVAAGDLIAYRIGRPYGTGRYGTGRYATLGPLGQAVMYVSWAALNPCDPGVWTLAEPCA